jgi:hypothetical protein
MHNLITDHLILIFNHLLIFLYVIPKQKEKLTNIFA